MTDRLGRDERGAIMVMGVFMAAFMAGVVFHAVELAETIYLRERLQDGADAGAFSAAVTCARGMNVIVLVNLVMAALLAVLVVLRVIEMLATLAILVLGALAFATFGGTAAAIPPVVKIREDVRALHAKLKDPVYAALKVLRTTSRVVRTVTPVAAQGTVLDISAEFKPGVSFAFAVPSRLTLPVADDRFDALCGKAAGFVAHLALKPFAFLPDEAEGEVVEAAEELAESTSDWFCGKSGAEAPSLKRRVTIVLPRLPERDACESRGDLSACEGVDALEARAAPDEQGDCQSDCGLGGAYDTRARLAREQCDPSDRRLMGFGWQEQRLRVVVERKQGEWVEMSRTPVGSPALVQRGDSDAAHPCGSDHALYSSGWNRLMHPRGSSATLPLCTEPWKPPVLGDGPTAVEVTQVLNVFRCSYTEERNIAAGSDFDGDRENREAAAGDIEHSPQKVEDDLALGDEAFLLRVVAVPPAEAKEADIVGVAVWNANAAKAVETFVPRIGLAQAEYFFDGIEDRAEWMWHMKWRARLRRVSWPEKSDGSRGTAETRVASIASACAARVTKDAACPAVEETERFTSWMVH